MPLLVRKIEKAKWQQNDILNGEEVSADAITNCTRTTRNSLSLWFIQDESYLDDAVLALASQFQHLDSIDIVMLDESSLKVNGLNVKNSQMDLPVKRLNDSHYDVVELNYSSLGRFANFIVNEFKLQKVKRYTKAQIKKILQDSIGAGELQKEKLSDSIKLMV
jgi:hypothetical protein